MIEIKNFEKIDLLYLHPQSRSMKVLYRVYLSLCFSQELYQLQYPPPLLI